MSFRFNADPSKKRKKVVLKYIFAFKAPTSKKTMTQLAMLTTDNRYIEYEIGFRESDITSFVAKKLRVLFAPYEINYFTEVIFSRDYDVNTPLYMYMMFLQQQMQFNLRTVTLEVILRGIVAYHQSYLKVHGKKVTKMHLNQLWKKVVEKKVCPWITEQYNDFLETISPYKAHEKKILRLGVYYLILKNYRDAIWRKGFQKKQEELKRVQSIQREYKEGIQTL